MADRMTATLWEPVQAHQLFRQAWEHCKSLLLAGHRLELEVRPTSKTRDTEEKYHAVIGEITKALRSAGSQLNREDVKRLMLEQFAEDTGREKGKLLPSLDGKRLVQTQLLSRKFSQADGNEFIEWLHAWCVENGVELSR